MSTIISTNCPEQVAPSEESVITPNKDPDPLIKSASHPSDEDLYDNNNEIDLLDDAEHFDCDDDWDKITAWENSLSRLAEPQTILPAPEAIFTKQKNDSHIPVPQKFLCALSATLMENPVRVTGSLRSALPLAYEQNALENYLDDHGFDEEAFQQIMPDLALKREIKDFLKKTG